MKNTECIPSLLVLLSSMNVAYAAQDTHVDVLAGQVLSENDLLLGIFNGQSFDLSPTTFFDIQSGGVIGPIESSGIDKPFNFAGSTIHVNSGGQYSRFLDPWSYATNLNLNAANGSMIFDLYLSGASSALNVDGATVFLGSASSGATVNMTDGFFVSGYSIFDKSTLNMSGGSMGGVFNASNQSVVNMDGGVMGINSSVTDGSEMNLSGGVVESGFHSETGSVVNISGGTIGDSFRARLSIVNLSHGEIGDEYHTFTNETYVSGGDIGNSFWADSGSTVYMSSGSIGNDFYVGPEIFFAQHVVVNMSGGSIGDRAKILHRGTINISGGSIGEAFTAFTGSSVNLFVTELMIDGQVVDLELNKETLISTRGGALLEAVLADGTYLDFTLNSTHVAGEDRFETSTGLTVTFVPAPGIGTMLGILGVLGFRRHRGLPQKQD